MNKLQQSGELTHSKDRLIPVLPKVMGQGLINEETGRNLSSFPPLVKCLNRPLSFPTEGFSVTSTLSLANLGENWTGIQDGLHSEEVGGITQERGTLESTYFGM